jgi:hypothetical protein
MANLVVPQEGEAELGVESSAAVQVLVKQQRRRDTIQSFVSGIFILGLIMVVLGLIAILDWGIESPTIVTYAAPNPEEVEIERPEMSQQARPKPAGPKSSRAKVIASTVPSPTSVPVPDNPIPEGPFGMAEEIGEGFGDSDGDGDGGGGVSFFGNYRTGKRVVFIVDFSGSMESDAEAGGGTRIEGLKKELIRSIENLPSKLNFTVIFFSSSGWHIGTEGPDFVGNGWSGAGEAPGTEWYPATQQVKHSVIQQIKAMPAKGGTVWYPPLKMAMTMHPSPTTVYLLSDGDPRDGDSVLFDMGEINPNGIPIDTIAFELAGSPASMLMEIAKTTGGRFSMVYKGELLTGRAAEKYTNSSFD